MLRAYMIKAFSLALAQLTDPKILKLLAKTIALTLLVFAVLGVILWYALGAAIASTGYSIEENTVDYFVGIVTFLLTFMAAWIWFRLVAIAVLQVFGDEIVLAVENKHYAHTAHTAHDVGFRRGLALGLKSLGRALLLNIVALPLYIALMVTGIGLPIALLLVNALLLGRDLQDMVVARHSQNVTDPAWTMSAGKRFGLGLIIAALFLVPFVNLLAPIIGAAMATHLVHRGKSDNVASDIFQTE